MLIDTAQHYHRLVSSNAKSVRALLNKLKLDGVHSVVATNRGKGDGDNR